MALLEYYCMPADFKVQILEEDELYDEHAQLWDELSEMLGGEVRVAESHSFCAQSRILSCRTMTPVVCREDRQTGERFSLIDVFWRLTSGRRV